PSRGRGWRWRAFGSGRPWAPGVYPGKWRREGVAVPLSAPAPPSTVAACQGPGACYAFAYGGYTVPGCDCPDRARAGPNRSLRPQIHRRRRRNGRTDPPPQRPSGVAQPRGRRDPPDRPAARERGRLMASIDIEVAGRRYNVACRDGEEAHLHSVAAMVDQRA